MLVNRVGDVGLMLGICTAFLTQSSSGRIPARKLHTLFRQLNQPNQLYQLKELFVTLARFPETS